MASAPRSTNTNKSGSGSRSNSGAKSSGGSSRSGGGSSRSGSGSSASRSNSGSRQSTPRQSETYHQRTLQDEENDQVKREIIFLVGLAVTIFLTLCNFHLIGKVGEAISAFLFGTFGTMAYLAPAALFIGIVFGYANQGAFAAALKIASGAVLFFLVGMICDMFSGYSEGLAAYSGKELYRLSMENRNGGGLLSGSISYALLHNIGKAGTILIIIALLAICFVLLTRRSLIGAVKSGSHAISQKAVDMNETRKRMAEERRRPRLADFGGDTPALPGEDVRELPAPTDQQLPAVTEGEDAGEAAHTPVPYARRTLREELQEKSEQLRQSREAQKKEQEIRRAEEKKKKEEEKRLRREEKEAERILQVEKNYNPDGDIYDDPVHSGELHEISPYEEEFDPETGEIYSPAPEDFEEAEAEPAPHRHFQFERQPLRDRHTVDAWESEEVEEYAPEPILTYEEEAPRPEPVSEPAPEPEYPRNGSVRVYTQGDVTGGVSQPVVIGTRAVDSYERKQSAPERSDVSDTRAEVRRPEKKPVDQNRPFNAARYQFPPLKLLTKGDGQKVDRTEEMRTNQEKLLSTLASFGVNIVKTEITQGPTVTRFEIYPEQGVKVAKIVGLQDDIKMSLAATDIRIEAPIPGKSAIGIEVPNAENTVVKLRDLLESSEFKNAKSKLSFAVGKDIAGSTVVSDIAKMPHVLIAGSTGSGKSVCINTLIMSILYKASPEDVQLILIDPKVVEMSVYNGIPHLILPVVTDPKLASGTLQWGVKEMERRYRLFADFNVRDLAGFNEKAEEQKRRIEAGQAKPGEAHVSKLPQIVIVIDELADLMMVAPGDVEAAICRLAQLARAAGIHLVVATQRPSVDVITGLIKANMPSRVAFAVSSGVDSRTILDQVGAEKLLGKGDMLFYPQGYSKPARLQGAFVSDEEVGRVVRFLTEQRMGNPHAEDYEDALGNISSLAESSGGKSGSGSKGMAAAAPDDGRDEYFAEAGRSIVKSGKASIGSLQRLLKIGFNRAARIMDSLEEAGVVGPEQGTKPREILMTESQFEEFLQNME